MITAGASNVRERNGRNLGLIGMLREVEDWGTVRVGIVIYVFSYVWPHTASAVLPHSCAAALPADIHVYISRCRIAWGLTTTLVIESLSFLYLFIHVHYPFLLRDCHTMLTPQVGHANPCQIVPRLPARRRMALKSHHKNHITVS